MSCVIPEYDVHSQCCVSLLSSSRMLHCPKRKPCTRSIHSPLLLLANPRLISVSAPSPTLDISCNWNLKVGTFLCLLTYFCLFIWNSIFVIWKGNPRWIRDQIYFLKALLVSVCASSLGREHCAKCDPTAWSWLDNGWLLLCPKQKWEKCRNLEKQTTRWNAFLTETQGQRKV